MKFNLSNTFVYGLDHSLKASGNPLRTEFDLSDVTEKDINRGMKLGAAKAGSGHDNFLKGIIVQVDIIAPLYWWKEAQRYHWFDFISSQSTMHCLLKFDVEQQVVEETDKRVVAVIKDLIKEYNEIPADDLETRKAKWREIVASLPCGFCLGASMTTNYQQLKTMYFQRRDHKLVEWHIFCDWVLQLPKFKELVGIIEENK